MSLRRLNSSALSQALSKVIPPLVLGVSAWGAATPALALDLLTNGGFEADAGPLQSPDPVTGWTTQEAGLLGGVAVLSDLAAPGSGHSTVGAQQGAHYALLDLSQPGYAVLAQNFTIGAAGVAAGQLTYGLFASSFAGMSPPGLALDKGLDYENADAMLSVRVDILKPGASLLSTASADIVRSFQPTVDFAGSDATPATYTAYSHALGATDLLAGQTYTLRFAAAGNAGQALVGIDNVALNVSAVPEPATWGLMAAGLLLVAGRARRSRPQRPSSTSTVRSQA